MASALHFLISCFLTLFLIVHAEVETMKEISGANITGGVIHKCSCGMNEAINNGTCIPSNNIIPVWDFTQGKDFLVQLSAFPNVSVNPIYCQDGYTKLSLNFTQFIIYNNGLLDNRVLLEEPPTEDYCVDHILSDESLTIVAEVCSKNPVIPTCCPVDHVSNDKGECIFNDSVQFNPRLVGGFQWTEYDLTEQKIACGEGQVLKRELITFPTEVGASLVSYPLGFMLQWNSIYNTFSEYLQFDQYCVNANASPYGTLYFAEFCIPDPKMEHEKTCSNATCLRKCCPHGFIYDIMHSSCVPEHNFQVSYEFFGSDYQEIQEPEDVTLTFGIPFCKEFHILPEKGQNASYLKFFADGSLIATENQKFSSLEYCVDGFTHNFRSVNRTINNSAIVCFKDFQRPCEWRWVLGSVLIGISCLFYITTMIVYITIKDLRSKLFGKCLISQVSALLVAYFTLIFLQNSDNYSELTCNLPGTIEHITILASFFWLNVMCYDMWIKIKTVKFSDKTTPHTTKRFLLYCVYAWGVPLLIGLIRVAIDNFPETENTQWLVRANLGKTHCFFSSDFSLAKWVYFYGPILVLLLVNLCFFFHVAHIIIKTKRETARLIASGDSSQTGRNFAARKQRALLLLKLFLVMGISWLLEIVMWVAVKESDCYFWGLDIVNLLQGVFIFVIFVCKKSTRNKIWEWFRPMPSLASEEYTLTDNEKARKEIRNIVA